MEMFIVLWLGDSSVTIPTFLLLQRAYTLLHHIRILWVYSKRFLENKSSLYIYMFSALQLQRKMKALRANYRHVSLLCSAPLRTSPVEQNHFWKTGLKLMHWTERCQVLYFGTMSVFLTKLFISVRVWRSVLVALYMIWLCPSSKTKISLSFQSEHPACWWELNLGDSIQSAKFQRVTLLSGHFLRVFSVLI